MAAESFVIRPDHNPPGVTVKVGASFDGRVELGVTLGTLQHATVLLDVRAAEMVALALQGAILRLQLGDDQGDEDEPDYEWLEG